MPPSLDILHYNILDGFAGDARRVAIFLDWLARGESPDLLSFNEYRPGDDALCSGLLNAGYVHHAINTSAPYANLCAVFSRHAFSEVETADDFRFLRVRVGALDIVNYHASPAGVAAVLAEQDRLLRRLEGLGRIVLVGDFNSLAPTIANGSPARDARRRSIISTRAKSPPPLSSGSATRAFARSAPVLRKTERPCRPPFRARTSSVSRCDWITRLCARPRSPRSPGC
jgi:Exonuclease III